MASSIRTSTISPTSFAHSPPQSPEPDDASSLALVSGTSTSIPSISKTTKIRRSHALLTSEENTPLHSYPHSLRSHSPSISNINISVMDDATLLSMARRAHKKASNAALTSETRALNKKKSQFYGEVFAYRAPHTSARDRVTRDSIVMAELKTNVIVRPYPLLFTSLRPTNSTPFKPAVSSLTPFLFTAQGRIHPNNRPILPPLPPLPTPRILNPNHRHAQRMPPPLRLLRPRLHPYHHRHTLPNRPSNKQTQRPSHRRVP